MDLNFCCIQKTVIFKACRSYLILAANDNKSPSTMMQIQSTTHAKITTGTTHTNKRHCHAFVQKGAVQPLKLSWMQKLLQTSLCNPPNQTLLSPLCWMTAGSWHLRSHKFDSNIVIEKQIELLTILLGRELSKMLILFCLKIRLWICQLFSILILLGCNQAGAVLLSLWLFSFLMKFLSYQKKGIATYELYISLPKQND